MSFNTQRDARCMDCVNKYVSNLRKSECYMTWIPATRGRYLQTGADCNVDTGHNDFLVRENASPGFFLVYKGDEKRKFYVCKSSRHFVYYQQQALREMCEILRMNAVLLPSDILFVGHGYFQHWGAEFPGHVHLRYYFQFSAEDLVLQSSISFVFQASLDLATELVHVDTFKDGGNVAISSLVARH